MAAHGSGILSWFTVTIVFVCVLNIEAFSRKALICTDPDTGELHDVNTTWPSKTFCGINTCKLRRKNFFETQLIPIIRKFNVNNVNITKPINKPEIDVNMVQNNEPKNVVTTTVEAIKIHPNKISIQQIDKKNVIGKATDNTDKLTEKEIKTISDLLHDVKKSDLEAIVDIYNLAQDLYKEMDKVTSENIIEETSNAIKQEKANNILKSSNIFDKHKTYRHEPLRSVPINYKTKEVNDMEHQGSNFVASAAPPKQDDSYSYFSGASTTNNFGALPYYYPTSSFRLPSSYIHPPCAAPQYYQNPCSYPSTTTKPVSQGFNGVIKKPFVVDSQKYAQPLLLPYPFSYVQHYYTNGSYDQNKQYYDGNPWSYYEYYKNYYQPYYTAKHFQPQLVNTAESNEPQLTDEKPKAVDLIETLLSKAKIENKNVPEWQTGPLPKDIIDEIRANFEQKSKLFKPISLRKKINLERVGKVIKLDDLNRNKRSIDHLDDDLYEAYIDKTTCESDFDPGYYRVGNITAPYPDCCPQRITN